MEIVVAVLYLLPFWKLLEPSWCFSKPFEIGASIKMLVQKNCTELFLPVFKLRVN